MVIRGHFPGRVCLLGEHCDWAGGASLAVPLPMGVSVEGVEGEDGVSCRSEFEGDLLEGRWDPTGLLDRNGGPLRFVPAAVHALRERGVTVPPTHLEVSSDLPAGRGFSSSAAFTLAVLEVLSRRARIDLEVRELAELAFHVEHDLLGVPCGRLDQLACSARQPVFLTWNAGYPVDVKAVTPGGQFHLVVAVFSQPRNTAAILETLNRHFFDPDHHEHAVAVRTAVTTWGRSAHRGQLALRQGDVRGLGEAMNAAQRVYDTELHARMPALRGPRLRETCAELTTALGAVGAKFSGAGGDGSVVALFESEPLAVAAATALNDAPDITAWLCPLA